MNGAKKESKYVKTKIIAGYILLAAACFAAVGYVYRVAERATTPDGSYVLSQTKRNAVSRTLYHLYQAESYGQMMVAGYRSYEKRYRDELRTVRGCIDTLRQLSATGNSVQIQAQRLDSIVRLIDDKERRTMNLFRSIRSAGTVGLLDKNIRQLLETPDTLPRPDTVSIAVGSVVREDTLTVPKQRRRFFRRLADVFSPPKSDSNVVISRREVVETVAAPPTVKDTITTVLHALQDSIANERQNFYDRAWREGLRLRSSNELVNTKILRLISDFEAEDTARFLQRIARNEAIRERASSILTTITGVALLLVLIFVAILWRDINRSIRYRRELERVNRDNEALLAAREKLMLAITHDIKAPLGSVMGYIDLLSRLDNDRRGALYLDNMKDSAEHLAALVDSLLDFYRLDIRKVELHPVVFQPLRLFESIRTGFAAQARTKDLELRFEPGEGCSDNVSGDALRIRQIAENLISNALKFTDRGSVTIRATRIDERLIFSVRDTGRGISREEKQRIFDEFVRLRSAQGVEGFGLGLSIVRRLVELLGGSISVESRLGEGSRFIVSLPIDAAPQQVVQPPQVAESAVRHCRVLLVDDDPLQLDMTAAMCRRAGIEAACCDDPAYVERLVAGNRFDALLTDIQMPAADGFAVLAAVRKIAPSLPVIAVSAREELRHEDFAACGFAACLRKPFASGELIAAIAAVCEDLPRQKEPPTDASFPESETPAEGWNFGALTAFAGDDRDAAQRILHSFAASMREECRRLRTALEAADAAAIAASAHKMAPTLTMIGAVEIVAVLRRAERQWDPSDEGLKLGIADATEKIEGIAAESEKWVTL